MTIHAHHSSYELSELQRQHMAHRERQQRMFGKPKVVNIIGHMKLLPEPVNAPEVPKPMRQIITPTDFIKSRCDHYDISYQLLISTDKQAALASVRRAIMQETSARYPHLTIGKLAALFHRHSATISYALGHLPGKRSSMAIVAERDRLATAMHRQGKSNEEIARELECSSRTVRSIARRRGWDRPAKPKVKVEHPHEREARELFEKGLTRADVARHTGMHKETIRKIAKRWNWTRGKA